jgi:hypothetical protein
LIFRGDARLAALLEPVAETAKWWFRKPHELAECLEMLPRGGPSVLVLRLGRDLEDELAALDRIRRSFPDAAVVVVGEADQAALAGLAWDLGARFVLFPPLPRDLLHRLRRLRGGLPDGMPGDGRPVAVAAPAGRLRGVRAVRCGLPGGRGDRPRRFLQTLTHGRSHRSAVARSAYAPHG